MDGSVAGRIGPGDTSLEDPQRPSQTLLGDWHPVVIEEPGTYSFELHALFEAGRLLLWDPLSRTVQEAREENGRQRPEDHDRIGADALAGLRGSDRRERRTLRAAPVPHLAHAGRHRGPRRAHRRLRIPGGSVHPRSGRRPGLDRLPARRHGGDQRIRRRRKHEDPLASRSCAGDSRKVRPRPRTSCTSAWS